MTDVETPQEVVEMNGDEDQTASQPQKVRPPPPKQIYIVRLPRRENQKEEEQQKALQEQLKGFLTKMKAIREKRQRLRVRGVQQLSP